jgi:plasmid stabilization system protein ParE
VPGLIWSAAAIADLTRIRSWLLEIDPALALAAAMAIRERANFLPEFPGIGTPLPGNRRKLPVPRFGYLIFYRQQGNTITILRIRHEREGWA